ncbi:MAG: hypothetical protein ACUVQT_09900, partial [bacterium]
MIISLIKGEEPSAPFYTRLGITEGNAKVNSEFTLTFSLKALVDLPMSLVICEIPKGVEWVGGALVDTIYPHLNDSISVSAKLKITQPGPYCITMHTIIAPSETISFLQHFAKDFYIMSTTDSATYSEEPNKGLYYNLISDEVIGEIPPEPPQIEYYSVSGTLRYWDKTTSSYEPMQNILAILVNSSGQVAASTYSNSVGYYSMSAPAGVYTLLILAANTAGEVHECWRADVDYSYTIIDIDLDCSRPTHRFVNQQIALYSNLTVNFNATNENADRARILWHIKRDKDWMWSHTSPHYTLDFIEVSYPPVIYVDMPPRFDDFTFELERGTFYAYFGKLEEVKVKLPPNIPLIGGHWWGVGVSYRHSHQIVIEENKIWTPTGALSHEWCHGLMVSTLGNKVPYDWGHAEHRYYDVFNTGHAFSEGFAEFCAPAMWVAETQNTNPTPEQLEIFYRTGNHPWYQGPEPNFSNTNGSFVEGSVFQFLWDLFDDRNTKDHEPNFDDDGVYGGIAKIMNTLTSLDTIMTVETSNWDTLGNIEGDSIAFKSKKAYFPGPNYDFIGKFKDCWHALNYGDITELFNVDIHPFNYLDPYPVPAPSDLVITFLDPVNKKVEISWTNNAVNQGAFFIYRNLNNAGYVRYYTLNDPNKRYFTDNIQEGNSYGFRVKAMTCDTSSFSNEVTIPWYVASPTMQPVVDMLPNQAKVSWQNNSNLTISSYTLSRWNDVTNTWKDDYKTGLTATFFDDTVTFLHKYKYRVKAKESGGHWSDWSNIVEYSSGMLAQSNYPKMSAYNSNAKVVRGADGKIHVLYYDDTHRSMYYSYSSDQGVSFKPWRYLGSYSPYYIPDTIPAIAIDDSGNPYIAYGENYNNEVMYWVGWVRDTTPTYPEIIFRSGQPSARPYPPSFVWAGDTGFVVFTDKDNSKIIVARYRHPVMETDTISKQENFGPLTAIAYDKGGRIVVLAVSPPVAGIPIIYYRRKGSPSWDSVDIPNVCVYGMPSLWAGENELRITFEGYSNGQDGLFFLRIPWQNNTYDVNQPPELVSTNFDYDPNLIEGYSYLASRDVVLWKDTNDIWYAQRMGPGTWQVLGNLSASSDISSYPQGIVFGSFLRQKLFALWTEKLGNNYYLVRKIVNLPSAYPSVLTIAQSDIPEATGYNNARRLLRDNQGILHLAFTSGDSVYHTFLQDTSWSEPVAIGEGKYPALALDNSGKIYCVWCYNG